jgi:hypothetical protein
MMILFGGGDGGGIYIGADGKIHRIPPWTPDFMLELKAVNALTAASQRLGNAGLAKEMFSLAERVSTTVVPEIAKSVHGGVSANESVAFIDADDGFTCGTTGKHPIPFPIPHGVFTPGVDPRVASGQLSGATVHA